MSVWMRRVLVLVWFLGCIVLLLYGHSVTGIVGTALMLLSILGLLMLLYVYNRHTR